MFLLEVFSMNFQICRVSFVHLIAVTSDSTGYLTSTLTNSTFVKRQTSRARARCFHSRDYNADIIMLYYSNLSIKIQFSREMHKLVSNIHVYMYNSIIFICILPSNTPIFLCVYIVLSCIIYLYFVLTCLKKRNLHKHKSDL